MLLFSSSQVQINFAECLAVFHCGDYYHDPALYAGVMGNTETNSQAIPFGIRHEMHIA